MPFLLDPTLPSTPVNKRARYEAKFGGAEKVAAMERVMKEKARACGINLSYGGEMSQPTDALRLSSLAWEMGGMERQLDLMERLFKVRLRLERRQPWPLEVSAMPLCSRSAFTCALSRRVTLSRRRTSATGRSSCPRRSRQRSFLRRPRFV
jgi:hypothetical protein